MTDRVGQQLGNYRLSRLLGKGGFAEVYLGEHVYLKTPAAIKLLQTKVANEEDLQAFLAEAQTIAQLVHPHIVRVLDFGVDGDIPFLVMDYATGGSLRQRHPRGTPLPLTTIVPYIKQVAEALQYAHGEKFIHRDVKPENMLVGRREAVLLSDFGIALMAQSSRYQSTQEVIGTVAYMSPEQIQGKPRPASDQYSLGVVVYEWLCGDRPFHGSFTELCTQHMFASPPPLREKFPTISPEVEQVVMTALVKDPRQRFGSVQAFANALEQASQVPHLAPVPAQPISPPLLSPTPREPVDSLPLPPAQNVGGPTLHEESFSSSTSAPVEVMPITGPTGRKVVSTEGKSEKVNIWKIGKQQIVAMIVGTILYVGLSHLYIYINPGFHLIGTLPAIIIPLFLGIVFGPWVGLFTGMVGYIIGGYIPLHPYLILGNIHISYAYLYLDRYWWIVSSALVGFVAGLTTLITKGHYNTIRIIGFVDTITAIVVFISLSFPYIVLTTNGFSSQDVLIYILHIVLPTTILILILTPIMLVIYNRIPSRGKSTSTTG